MGICSDKIRIFSVHTTLFFVYKIKSNCGRFQYYSQSKRVRRYLFLKTPSGGSFSIFSGILLFTHVSSGRSSLSIHWQSPAVLFFNFLFFSPRALSLNQSYSGITHDHWVMGFLRQHTQNLLDLNTELIQRMQIFEYWSLTKNLNQLVWTGNSNIFLVRLLQKVVVIFPNCRCSIGIQLELDQMMTDSL